MFWVYVWGTNSIEDPQGPRAETIPRSTGGHPEHCAPVLAEGSARTVFSLSVRDPGNTGDAGTHICVVPKDAVRSRPGHLDPSNSRNHTHSGSTAENEGTRNAHTQQRGKGKRHTQKANNDMTVAQLTNGAAQFKGLRSASGSTERTDQQVCRRPTGRLQVVAAARSSWKPRVCALRSVPTFALL